MDKIKAKHFIQEILQSAGININGSQPWDFQVHNDNFYTRLLHHGALGLGESYVDQWWDCEQLDALFTRILSAKLDQTVQIPWHFIIKQLFARIFSFQTRTRAYQVAQQHYDLGNSLFVAMLDKRMIYSCGYWKEADNLDDAQAAKLELICQKLQLKPGLRLLDIGCGWGGLAKYAAEKYGAQVVGVTISKQQYELAKD